MDTEAQSSTEQEHEWEREQKQTKLRKQRNYLMQDIQYFIIKWAKSANELEKWVFPSRK